ncbi:hypothetical protein JHK87_014941 [Glycine soja]|nr:hypothetical protein JHK87_014941 [Glycine soja]
MEGISDNIQLDSANSMPDSNFLYHRINAAEEKEASTSTTSIIFNTVGRAHYAFDIYSLPIQQPPTPDRELRLTDGHFFISPDSTRIGYHRCRGEPDNHSSPQLLLESVKSLVPGLSLFRFVGEFPAFSPSGDRFAYNDMP